jgi:hypothetical protein
MSSSAHVAMLNQQAGCEKGLKFVEINYMNESTIINTFDNVYLVFNYNQDNPASQNKAEKLSASSFTPSFKEDPLACEEKKISSLLPNVQMINSTYPSREFSLPLNYIK